MKTQHFSTKLFKAFIWSLLLGLTVFVMMTSCSEKQYKVTPELVTYVDEFYKQAKAHGYNLEPNVIVSIGDVKKDCKCSGYTRKDGPTPTVVIDKWFYNYITTSNDTTNNWLLNVLEVVVFHEMGHAILNKDHSETGIMHPGGLVGDSSKKMVKYSTDSLVRELYINELFAK